MIYITIKVYILQIFNFLKVCEIIGTIVHEGMLRKCLEFSYVIAILKNRDPHCKLTWKNKLIN